jgi:hypothetical protein
VPEGQRIDYWSMLYDMSAISNDTNVAFKGWCEDKSGKGNIITPQQINSYRINKETVLYAIYGPNDNTADNSQYNKQDSENENEHIHSLVKVNKTSATYTKAGNTTYYYCETCGKYYSDKAGTKEIKKNSWIIPKLSKRSQSMTIKGASKKVKRSKVKKKNLVIKVITVKAAEGKVSYKIVGGNKKSKKALKIDGKTGKLTIKKGTKKGSYKVTVAVTAAGNDKYKACTKQVSVNIKVK